MTTPAGVERSFISQRSCVLFDTLVAGSTEIDGVIRPNNVRAGALLLTTLRVMVPENMNRARGKSTSSYRWFWKSVLHLRLDYQSRVLAFLFFFYTKALFSHYLYV